jgi:hypothetical protein
MSFPSPFLRRPRAAGIAAISAVALAPTAYGAPPQTTTALICTNPVSQVRWQIRIDFKRSTVDSNPARISEAKISWRDRTDGGNYTLDRRSGDLTVILASSTGGYSLHDRCALDPVRPGS